MRTNLLKLFFVNQFYFVPKFIKLGKGKLIQSGVVHWNEEFDLFNVFMHAQKRILINQFTVIFPNPARTS